MTNQPINLLMISGDRSLIKGEKGPFYYLLQEFSKYWERIDIICPGSEVNKGQAFNKVNLYGVQNSVQSIFKKAKEIYQQSKFEVMTVHDYPPFKHSKAAKLINQHLGVPYMVELHHIVGYPKKADVKEWLLKIYSEIFLKSVTKSAKAIRVVNKNQVPKFLQIAGIPKEKIVYLPSFYIDREVFCPQELEKKYDLLFVGRLAKNKGLDLLTEVLVKLKKDLPEFKMAVVGRGKSEVVSSKSVITENVEFLGWLPDSQSLAKVYNQSKILLITSYNEGGPRVGLEAMACGLPVISTKVGIMVDLITNGHNGYLADWSADEFVGSIKKLLADEDLRQKIGQEAQQAVKQFDYSKMIKDYAEGVKKLIKNG